MDNNFDLFLDSGAYSGHTKGITIDINQYITYIKKNIAYIDVYANLDVIGNPKATLVNQKIMEKAGLKPLPCFHYNENWKNLKDQEQLEYWQYLKDYVNGGHDYIGLGGVARIRGQKSKDWFTECFKLICDENGHPKVKVHGFAITDVDSLWEFPFFSVDSTSWIKMSRMSGSVYVPRIIAGKYDYRKKPYIIKPSNLDNLKPDVKAHCEKYFKEKGFMVGASEIKLVDPGYKLKRKERPDTSKDKDGKEAVEVMEYGLSNVNWHRDELNAIYFLDLEKALNEHKPFVLSPLKLAL
jgi:hypothetical protein